MSEKLLQLKELREEQDKHLTDISKSLIGLRYGANEINIEIKSQVNKLEGINDDVNATSNNMRSANYNMEKFIKKNEKCCWIGIIALLLFVLLILIVIASM